MVNLTHSVNVVAKDIIGVVNVVPRIKSFNFGSDVVPPEANVSFQADCANTVTDGSAVVAATTTSAPVKDDDKMKAYYDIIADDSDIIRLVLQVMNGMSSSATELQKYLSYWDKYQNLTMNSRQVETIIHNHS